VGTFNREHTRKQAVSFWIKSRIFQTQRGVHNLFKGQSPLCKTSEKRGQTVAVSRSPLYSSNQPAEIELQAGKIQNLRIAARYLNGIQIPRDGLFSFWAQVPRPSKRLGFVEGRELREGCLVPSVGGGLCQISNALFDVALQAGFRIVERHAHSRQFPESRAALGRDATVYWNYVDLQFQANIPVRLDVQLSRDELTVEFFSEEPALISHFPHVVKSPERAEAESCETCGVITCFRHRPDIGQGEVTAWLMDSWMPELDRYLLKKRANRDWLFLPTVHGGMANYRWSRKGFAQVRHSSWQVLHRSFISRRLKAQGAERQRALLQMDANLAASYARKLPPLAVHLTVAQNLLPHLWKSGVLGGRSFDVFMNRLPATDLHAILDVAATKFPFSPTLQDFRADAAFVEAESEALAAAEKWISPHPVILSRAGKKGLLLPWIFSNNEAGRKADPRGPVIFPASTLARKGCYEMREAARRLNLTVALGGSVLESGGFWDGVNLASQAWPENAGLVALPAWVEHQPRRLLKAVAMGIPVVASEACGLKDIPGVHTFPTGDLDAFVELIENIRANPLGRMKRS